MPEESLGQMMALIFGSACSEMSRASCPSVSAGSSADKNGARIGSLVS